MSAIGTLLHAANLAVNAHRATGGNGMGFLEGDDYGFDYYYDDQWDWGYDGYGWDSSGGYYYDDWGWYDPYSDEWGYWDFQSDDPYSDLSNTLDWWSNLDNTIYTSEPYDYSDLQSTLDWWSSISSTPTGNDPWMPDDFWDWAADAVGGGSNPTLPGYCPAGTYHPVGDPYSCVPFPPDPTANRAAQNQRRQQQQAAQKAAQTARKAQQKQDQQCQPINGQRTWKNPQTGKCETVPNCPHGQQFDSASRRCLTPDQVKQLYGGNNWLLWALIAIGAIVVIKK